jgi:hypothetical protein
MNGSPTPTRDLVELRDAARRFHVLPLTLWQACEDGRLPYRRGMAGRVWVDARDVERFVGLPPTNEGKTDG